MDCVEDEDIIVVTNEPMVGLNVLIEDENNAILIDYAKKIGLVMKGMQISIIEK